MKTWKYILLFAVIGIIVACSKEEKEPEILCDLPAYPLLSFRYIDKQTGKDLAAGADAKIKKVYFFSTAEKEHLLLNYYPSENLYHSPYADTLRPFMTRLNYQRTDLFIEAVYKDNTRTMDHIKLSWIGGRCGSYPVIIAVNDQPVKGTPSFFAIEK
ncbi:hypothetical protein LX64_02847 [Chitinophaga skermanii]|uniref:Uncharacterized protein n=1 Tax=Chitinophaga skermanii TaxID=331697 RepID=A0A327QHT2_9BACT|nr:hypothetical protein [Chitinophaga skermanii]RAJ03970.1 hypothetical protein LX64_02847 [Chitinophaga skermanii]